MNELPTELVHKILEYCESEDVLDCRDVSKLFRSVANRIIRIRDDERCDEFLEEYSEAFWRLLRFLEDPIETGIVTSISMDLFFIEQHIELRLNINEIYNCYSLLMFFSKYGHRIKNSLEIIKKIIDYGANIDEQNGIGDTALILAVESNNSSIVKILVENSADVNLQNNSGQTPLMGTFTSTTTNKETHKIIETLVNAGADFDLIDNEGDTVLSNCIMCDNTKVIQMLIKAGVNVNLQDDDGVTPLMIATQINNDTAIELLIDAGADLTIKDNDGKTALQYLDNWKSAKLLVEAENSKN